MQKIGLIGLAIVGCSVHCTADTRLIVLMLEKSQKKKDEQSHVHVLVVPPIAYDGYPAQWLANFSDLQVLSRIPRSAYPSTTACRLCAPVGWISAQHRWWQSLHLY
jgi:hypothetical protein